MKRLIIVLILITSYLKADYYILTIDDSKSSLCTDMKVVFDKFIEGKELNRFKEFQAIKWDKKYNIINKGLDSIDSKYKKAMKYSEFDINNDGEDEIVKHGLMYKKYGDVENLYYFPKNIKSKISGKNSLDTRELRKLTKVIDLTDTYQLKKYPPFEIDNDNLKFYTKIYDPHIRPFLYEDKYYLALFGNQTIYKKLEPKKTRANNQVVIIEFTKENKINDLCYYVKVGE